MSLLPPALSLALALSPLVAAVSAQETSQEPDLSWFGRGAEVPEALGTRSPWEWGFLGDVMGEVTESQADPRFNELRFRSLDLHGAARIEDWARIYGTVDLAGGGSGSDLVLREAAAWFDALPLGMTLRAGKYFADLGAWNRTYVSDLASPNIDGVRRDFFGGNLALTGLELHQNLRKEGEGLRWSLGIAAQAEGQDPDRVGNGVVNVPDGKQTFGLDGIDRYAATARLEYGWRSPHDALALGASAYYAPKEKRVFQINPDNVVGTADDAFTREKVRSAIVGIDFRYRADLEGTRWHASTAEFWLKEAEHRDRFGVLGSNPSTGAWGQYVYGLDEHWSGGVLLSYWELSAGTGEVAASQNGAFVDYRIDELQRLRVFFNHTNPGPLIEKYFLAGLQYTFTFGAPHRSGLSW